MSQSRYFELQTPLSVRQLQPLIGHLCAGMWVSSDPADPGSRRVYICGQQQDEHVFFLQMEGEENGQLNPLTSRNLQVRVRDEHTVREIDFIYGEGGTSQIQWLLLALAPVALICLFYLFSEFHGIPLFVVGVFIVLLVVHLKRRTAGNKRSPVETDEMIAVMRQVLDAYTRLVEQ